MYSFFSHLPSLILKADIDSDFPVGDDPDPFEIENNSHEIYAEIRAKVYVGKSQYFNKIDRYLDEVGAAPLVIIGESGSGFVKSRDLGHNSQVKAHSLPIGR